MFQESGSPQYNSELVTLLLAILDTTTASGNSIRLVTLRLATMLLKELLGSSSSGAMLQDHHIALVENIYESSILQLRLFYKVQSSSVGHYLYQSFVSVQGEKYNIYVLPLHVFMWHFSYMYSHVVNLLVV